MYYTISEVAKLLGVSAHTLRYYEKEEIIVPQRNAHGERLYDESHVAWLRFVMSYIKKESLQLYPV